ncbi:MAG: hypothetical protein ACYTGO_07305 [Planctomycetota bacterium]|jgi:hypothetical protein
MRTPTLVLAVAFVCFGGLLPAQPLKYIASPKGLLAKEGNQNFFFGSNRRFQGIDHTHAGNVMVLKSFSLRRNGTSGTTNTAGTADAILDMGLANFGVLTREMDKNYMAGSRKNVFKKTNISFPNWGSGTTTPPAPFDFTLPFNTTFLYLGKNALLWDLTMQNNPSGGQVDRDYVSRTTSTAGSLGAGCLATGQTSSFIQNMSLQNNGAAMPNFGLRMVVGARTGPRNTGLMLSVALTNSNFTVPGWCAKVHAVPLFLAPLGTTDAAGLLRDRYFSGPYSPTATGLPIVSQLFGVDTGQVGSIVLSEGRSGTIPAPPTGGHEAAYLWCPITTTPNNGTIFCGGAIIARFGY